MSKRKGARECVVTSFHLRRKRMSSLLSLSALLLLFSFVEMAGVLREMPGWCRCAPFLANVPLVVGSAFCKWPRSVSEHLLAKLPPLLRIEEGSAVPGGTCILEVVSGGGVMLRCEVSGNNPVVPVTLLDERF